MKVDDHSRTERTTNCPPRAAIRALHPDKLRANSVVERLEAHELFNAITHAFEIYKESS